MLTDIFSWWQEQMRDLVPASLRSSTRTWRPTLFISPVTDSSAPPSPTATDDLIAELSLRGRSGDIDLGRHNLDGGGFQDILTRLPSSRRLAVVLRVQPDFVLERDVVVPLVAERDLRRVLAYDMDRLTPFAAQEIFWACRITSRDSARNRLHVRITIIPRARMTTILAALQRFELVPARIETTNPLPQQRVISIAEDQERYSWLGPRANGYALGACGALAMIAVALPFILQAVAEAGIESQIDTLRPQVALADGLRKKIVNHSTTSEAITAAQLQTGAPLQSIALLTDALPDDTFLTSLNLRQRKIMISGRSAAAARLIGTLASNPQFRNPAFTAPVIRDEASGGEIFSIRAELGS